MSARDAEETRGQTLGGGLGANFAGLSGRFRSVYLGPYRFDDVWGPGGANAAIGMEMMRRFITTFDARHGRMYLTPASAYDDPVPPPPG